MYLFLYVANGVRFLFVFRLLLRQAFLQHLCRFLLFLDCHLQRRPNARQLLAVHENKTNSDARATASYGALVFFGLSDRPVLQLGRFRFGIVQTSLQIRRFSLSLGNIFSQLCNRLVRTGDHRFFHLRRRKGDRVEGVVPTRLDGIGEGHFIFVQTVGQSDQISILVPHALQLVSQATHALLHFERQFAFLSFKGLPLFFLFLQPPLRSLQSNSEILRFLRGRFQRRDLQPVNRRTVNAYRQTARLLPLPPRC